LGDPNDLEDSEDCRSAGGHGNQYVRLRSAQIIYLEAICPAPAAFLLRAVAGVLRLPLSRPVVQDGSVHPEPIAVFEGCLKLLSADVVQDPRIGARLSQIFRIEEVEFCATVSKIDARPQLALG
jgi:hypothetical protein